MHCVVSFTFVTNVLLCNYICTLLIICSLWNNVYRRQHTTHKTLLRIWFKTLNATTFCIAYIFVVLNAFKHFLQHLLVQSCNSLHNRNKQKVNSTQKVYLLQLQKCDMKYFWIWKLFHFWDETKYFKCYSKRYEKHVYAN